MEADRDRLERELLREQRITIDRSYTPRQGFLGGVREEEDLTVSFIFRSLKLVS